MGFLKRGGFSRRWYFLSKESGLRVELYPEVEIITVFPSLREDTRNLLAVLGKRSLCPPSCLLARKDSDFSSVFIDTRAVFGSPL